MKVEIDFKRFKEWADDAGIEAVGFRTNLMIKNVLNGYGCDYDFIPKKRRKKANEAYSEEFLEFWDAYPACPNKSGKGAAWQEWFKIADSIGQDKLKSFCLASLAWQKMTDKWIQLDGKYICKPENYLKDRMFEDEKLQGLKQKERYLDFNGVWKER